MPALQVGGKDVRLGRVVSEGELRAERPDAGAQRPRRVARSPDDHVRSRHTGPHRGREDVAPRKDAPAKERHHVRASGAEAPLELVGNELRHVTHAEKRRDPVEVLCKSSVGHAFLPRRRSGSVGPIVRSGKPTDWRACRMM